MPTAAVCVYDVTVTVAPVERATATGNDVEVRVTDDAAWYKSMYISICYR